jgi:N-acetylglucosamine malate deacetylase 2
MAKGEHRLSGEPEVVSRTLTRRGFGLLGASALLGDVLYIDASEQPSLKALAVLAHPDDEYHFAATAYRIARELGGLVDQVVISNGEAGYHYSLLAEQVYGLNLTNESIGRAHLPRIRKQETVAAGRILGIRRHHFLNQTDTRYTLDPDEVDSVWDKPLISHFLSKLLAEEQYGLLLTLLPSQDTHGHHKAATLLALEAARKVPEAHRPLILGAEACSSHDPIREFVDLPGKPLTGAGSDVREFRRSRSFGYQNALSYQIIANWVIAEHKSQGLLQMDISRHDVERFWRFEASGPHSGERSDWLFAQLNGSSNEVHHEDKLRRTQ